MRSATAGGYVLILDGSNFVYLFALRLVPLFPFFVINLLMGLLPIGVVRYYWVSQLGMLPATVRTIRSMANCNSCTFSFAALDSSRMSMAWVSSW